MNARLLLIGLCVAPCFGSVALGQDIDRHWMPSASDAAAPPVGPQPGVQLPGHEAFRTEIGITTRGDSRSTLWVVSPIVSGAYRLGSRWAIGLDWGVALAIESPVHGDGEQRIGSGNPLLSVAHELLHSDDARLEGWLGVTAPLAWLADGTDRGFSRAMYAHALATRGLWNPWLWAPEQIGAACGGLWIVNASKDVGFRTEGALGATMPLSDVTQDAADVYLQLATSVELRAGLLSFGMRLQSVLMSATPDPLQLAIAPYGQIHVHAWTMDARMLINLDEPLGVVDAGLDAWGFLVSAQVTQ